MEDILVRGAAIIAVLLTAIQIAPIKIDPWSYFAKWIGKAINADVISDLREVKGELRDLKRRDSLQDEQREEDRALDARRRILQFGDDCRRGVRHSQEHFNSIFDDINFYRQYCVEHPRFENSKAVLTIRRIEDVYQKCVEENDFL